MSISRVATTLLAAVLLSGCAADEGDAGSTGSLARPLAVDSCGGAPTVSNGGFETGGFAPWTFKRRVSVLRLARHTGSWGVRLGREAGWTGHNLIEQTIHVPARSDAVSSSLSFWFQPHCSVKPDRFVTQVWSTSGEYLALLSKNCTNTGTWTPLSVDLTAWAGLDVVVRFDHYDDGVAETPSYTYVDDIQVLSEVAPPTVLITEPSDGANVSHLPEVTAEARVSACSSLDRVELYADGVLFATSPTSPATAGWSTTLAPATHTFLARVFDGAGGTAQHSVQVTTPCSEAPEWNVTHPLASTVQPVTPTIGPNGRDLDGLPLSAVFLPTDSRLFAHDAASAADLGSAITSGLIARPPLVVELGTGAAAATYVFAASADGRLYKYVMVGGVMQSAGSRDLRRPGCSGDKLSGTPAIQLKRFSNTGYTLAGDAIFVSTQHACGDHQENQIIALDPAAPIGAPPLWTFNEFGEYQVDGNAGGCTVDYALNRLYCATDKAPSVPTSVWAIDVNTGQPVWSHNAGPIVARPMLNPVSRHLFVVNLAGTLRAFDPDSVVNGSPAVDWSLPIPMPAGSTIVADPWPEHRGDLADRVFLTSTAGFLYMVADEGTSGSVKWEAQPLPGEFYTSEPVVLFRGSQAFVYVGTSSGRLMAVLPSETSGDNIHSYRDVGEPNTSVGGSTLLPNGLVVTGQNLAGGTVSKRFCAPFLPRSPF